MATVPQRQGVLSVSALTNLIKNALEGGFPAVWVKGELTGVKHAPSGHVYFSLKDREAQIDAVIWRREHGRLDFALRDGDQVEAFGDISVYAPRGRYQLNVREMRAAGLGALLQELEKLKKRLHAEGLFATERKRPLPKYPMSVGVVTSPVGAAVRDIVKVLRQRWPSIRIVLAPVRVQGEGAAGEITAAIRRFDRFRGVDLLIVGRGGGSIEDLWAFNQEHVVRAVATSRVPVIAAVGHEVDVTLTDLAADVRAATPSNAAEIAVPVRDKVWDHVARCTDALASAIHAGVTRRRRRLETLLEQHGFRRQRDWLSFLQQRVDDFRARIESGARGRLRGARQRIESVAQRYGLRGWPSRLAERRLRARHGGERLRGALARGVHARRVRLESYGHRLRALSPRLVLERGYCLARRPDGTLVRVAEGLVVGERIALEFARGEADARIEQVRPGGTDGT